MKVKIIIEETVSQEFEVEISSLEEGYKEISNMYKNQKLIVDDPTLIEAKLAILDEDGQADDFITIC